ncbi:MAG: GspH/FimT family pseudopilin [Gammaproteobacteria bacterium]
MSGFTVLELMVTLAVLFISFGIAGPQLNNFILSNRMVADLNRFTSSLHYARTEAAIRQASVSVCKTDSTSACNTSADWEDGWIVFTDTDGDGVIDSADGDTILRYNGPLGGIASIEHTGSAMNNRITFSALGRTGNTGTLWLCDSRGASESKGIVVAGSGRVRRAADNNDNGTIDQGDTNTGVTCP